ncbi:putative ATP binding protein [Corchorus olitorius]|uniref:ATP binding protein n=1 Tax=Corchorus olitorius TaxID=93759 RepID=A0A1R3HIT3_9ROSI|nr:putative ATP binding protein [Corchorus olitorius]
MKSNWSQVQRPSQLENSLVTASMEIKAMKESNDVESKAGESPSKVTEKTD